MTDPQTQDEVSAKAAGKPGFLTATGAAPKVPQDSRIAALGAKKRALRPLQFALLIGAIAIGAYLFESSRQAQIENQIVIANEAPVLADQPTSSATPVTSTPIPASGGLTVNNVKFEDTSGPDRRAYSVTAAEARERKDNRDIVDLTRLVAKVELANGEWIDVSAASGTFYRSQDRVDLAGAVQLDHANGMSFATEAAAVDLETHLASGAAPVTGKDDRTQISAQGFVMKDDGKTIEFTGKTRLVIQPSAKDANP